ncbi:MAG: metal-dependent hydrolase [Oceanococcus sp.]
MEAELTLTKPNINAPKSGKNADVLPTRRDISFDLPTEKILDWNGGEKHISLFMNTLSILFPVGERFFIKSMRDHRDQIDDAELKKAVTAFIGQEAMHGREHEDYNDAVFAATQGTEQQEEFVKALLGMFQKWTPKSLQLSGTIALEHFTAIMADGLLKEPRMLENADPAFANVWTWHALEETEHKSVAFDVWEKVYGKGARAYAERVTGQLIATPILLAVTSYYFLRMLKLEGELSNRKGWRSFFRLTYGEVGYARKLVKPWADYFKFNFHPWDHDNRQYLKLLEDFPESVTQAS